MERMDGLEVGPLVDASPARGDREALRRLARRDGCLYLPGLLDASAVAELRARVLEACERFGWLAPGSAPGQGLARDGLRGFRHDEPENLALQAEVLAAPALDRIRCDPAVFEVLEAVLGGEVAPGQGDVCRVAFPNAPERTTAPHQDGAYLGAERECWTVWTPLGDCPLALGPLAVLPGSHRGGLLDHAAGERAHLGVHAPPTSGWAAGDLACGDALMFHQLTLHRALPNRSAGRLRLSVDCRYRLAAGFPSRPAGPNQFTAN
jgi:hypothetical protein